MGFVGWFVHLFDSLRRDSLVCGNARARPEGRVLCLFGVGVLFFKVDVFELGSMAEQNGVFIHDVKLPAQQTDRTDGLEVERAIRIPLQHAPEPAGTSGQLTVFDAHPLLIIASVGARGLRLVGGGEHFDGLANVSVADPFGCGLPFLVDDFAWPP